MDKPLQGVRILSIEQFGAGPYGTALLADLGAEVLKIENPASGGDPARTGGPYPLGEHDSLYFQGWNTNKRSITLDLKSIAGRTAFERLVSDADVLFENLRGDQAAKLRIDYASLAPINPRIVCAHISAYGRDNSRSARPGYDFLMQAEAGLMSLTGDPLGEPARFGPSVIDFMTGATCAVGLLACLLRARSTGVGCDVDAALFDVALHQLNYVATWHLNGGHTASRLPRSSHFSAVPVQTFRAADGWIFIMCMTEKFWRLMLERLGAPELAADARFLSIEARREHRDDLTAELDARFSCQTMAHWVDRLGDIVPISPVYDVAQALADPFVSEIDMVRAVPHPLMPHMRLLANPLKINGERLLQQVGSGLGEDNAAYLTTQSATPPDDALHALAINNTTAGD